MLVAIDMSKNRQGVLYRATGRWPAPVDDRHSHNAPYRHFADKDALAAIGASGYELMGQSNAAAVAGLTDPAVLLAALGKAYIAFGVANPALYRLMFGQAFPSNRDLSYELLATIGGAREGLHGVIDAGIVDGTFAVAAGDMTASKTLSVSAWSIVHGAAYASFPELDPCGKAPAVSLAVRLREGRSGSYRAPERSP